MLKEKRQQAWRTTAPFITFLKRKSVSLEAKYNERGEILHGIHIETTARFYI